MIAATTEALLDILKYVLLALLYLFFARVLWAVWTEVRGPAPVSAPRQGDAADPTTPAPPPQVAAKVRSKPAKAPKAGKGRRGHVGRLQVLEPKSMKGVVYPVGDEVKIGRGPTCSIALPDDTFMSGLHARLARRDGAVYVEDLGSTNGTFVNGRKVTSPVALAAGDRLQTGNTLFEVQ